jgi:hypothetical protein
MDIDFNRGLTRLYVLLWAAWLGYWLLHLPRLVVSSRAPLVEVGVVGVVLPGLLLLALRWVGAGFRPSRNASTRGPGQ